jgi:hypothetical protein
LILTLANKKKIEKKWDKLGAIIDGILNPKSTLKDKNIC